MARTMDFPTTEIAKDPDTANYQNYLAWQVQQQERRRSALTQFNAYQSRLAHRSSDQVMYKEEANREREHVKDMVESRLLKACNCRSCEPTMKERSNSDASVMSDRSRRGSRECSRSLASASSQSPPGTTIRGPTTPSSKNAIVAASPPVSRHHQRQRQPRSIPESSVGVSST